MSALWDISAIAGVGILMAAALVRHFGKSLSGRSQPGCAGCRGGVKKPGAGRCG